MARLQAERRFYDGGSLDGREPPDRTRIPCVLLRRDLVDQPGWLWRLVGENQKRESFLLDRRIAYNARSKDGDIQILVPSNGDYKLDNKTRFRTDLTSVPNVFTWLIPRTGAHLPAALVHDGLICDPELPASYTAQRDTGPSQGEDVPIARIDADRIFREAMLDLGVGWVRRWLMWSAVTLATVWAGAADVAPPGTTSGKEVVAAGRKRSHHVANWYYRVVVFGSLLAIVVTGLLALLDVTDVWNKIPWMGNHSFARELGLGALFAVVIPILLALIFWWRLWPAGIIAGVALAVLLYVTLILLVLAFLFQLADFTFRQRHPADLTLPPDSGPAAGEQAGAERYRGNL